MEIFNKMVFYEVLSFLDCFDLFVVFIAKKDVCWKYLEKINFSINKLLALIYSNHTNVLTEMQKYNIDFDTVYNIFLKYHPLHFKYINKHITNLYVITLYNNKSQISDQINNYSNYNDDTVICNVEKKNVWTYQLFNIEDYCDRHRYVKNHKQIIDINNLPITNIISSD